MAQSTLLSPAELREGKSDQMGKPHSRKRSAKNAHNTKAPMDGEECDCGNKKKGRYDGGKCDCSGYSKKDMMAPPKRTDSLSAQEYLKAWDMGIQDRSTPYIRARLDEAERLDLKCGKGAISEGEKCTKGPATRVQPKQPTNRAGDPRVKAQKEFRQLLKDPSAVNKFYKAKGTTEGVGNKIKRAGELAARVGGSVVVSRGVSQISGGIVSGNLGEVSRGFRNVQLGGAALKLGAASKASRLGKKELSQELIKSAGRNVATGVGQEAAIGGYAGFNRAGGMRNVRSRARRAYQGAWMRSSGVRSMRDSVYASGFNVDASRLTP